MLCNLALIEDSKYTCKEMVGQCLRRIRGLPDGVVVFFEVHEGDVSSR